VHRGRSRTPCASLRCVIIRSDCPVYPLRKASRQLSSRGASPTRSRKRAFPHGFPRPPGASQSPEPLVLRARTQLNQRSTLLHNFHVFEPHSRESKRESQNERVKRAGESCTCPPPRVALCTRANSIIANTRQASNARCGAEGGIAPLSLTSSTPIVDDNRSASRSIAPKVPGGGGRAASIISDISRSLGPHGKGSVRALSEKR